MKKLIAYGDKDNALFMDRVKNKEEGRKAVLNNPMLALVVYVIYNGKRVEIRDIYSKWGA